jgi:ERCC4-type nuclease
MFFRPWKPTGTELYIRYYVSGSEGEFVGKEGGKLHITAASAARKMAIRNELLKAGINIEEIGLRELNVAMQACGLLESSFTHSGFPPRRPAYMPPEPKSFEFLNQSPRQLYEESLGLDPSSAPFREKTLNHGVIAIDHREPAKLKALVKQIKLETFEASLDLADFVISSKDNNDRELLIERKTITDFYTGVVRDDHHVHEQSERYYDYVFKRSEEGKHTKAIWIIEGEKNGDRLLYNTLPQIKQMDGLINYLTVINEQPVVWSYSQVHTAYLLAKFAQGWLERELFYSVKVGNVRIDKAKAKRAGVDKRNEPTSVIDAKKGLLDMLSLFPDIRTNVARELAASGRSFAEIVSMSESELLKVKGVGVESAKRIYRNFNMKA